MTIDDGSSKPLGHQTDDGELEVCNTGNGPEYHETDLGQHQRWMRQASDLYEKYMAALETIAKLREVQAGDPAVSISTRSVVLGEPERCGYCQELSRTFYSYNPTCVPDICEACYLASLPSPRAEPIP